MLICITWYKLWIAYDLLYGYVGTVSGVYRMKCNTCILGIWLGCWCIHIWLNKGVVTIWLMYSRFILDLRVKFILNLRVKFILDLRVNIILDLRVNFIRCWPDNYTDIQEIPGRYLACLVTINKMEYRVICTCLYIAVVWLYN